MGRQEYLRQMYLKNRGLLKDTTVSDLAYLDTNADNKNATYTVNDLNLDNEIDKQSAENFEDTDWWNRFTRTFSQMNGNITNGFFDFFEGIGDAFIGAAGTVGTWFGADDQWAKDAVSYDWSKDAADFMLKLNDTVNPFTAYKAQDIWDGTSYLDKVNQDSLFALNETANEWVSNIETMVGNMLPSIALDIATGGATVGVGKVQIGAGLAGMGVSAMGGGIEEALGDGAKSIGSATLYGLLSGAVETGTELIGGDRIAGITTKPFSDSLFKNLTKAFVSEGIEEVMSDLVNPIIQLAYKDNDSWENVGKHFMESYNPSTFAPELFQSFMMGGIGGLIFGGTAEINKYGEAGKKGYKYLSQASEVIELREQVEEANKKGNQKKAAALEEKLNSKIMELSQTSTEIGSDKKAQKAIVQQFQDYNDINEALKEANNSINELKKQLVGKKISIDEYSARKDNIVNNLNSEKFLNQEFKMTDAGIRENRFHKEEGGKQSNEKRPSKEELLGYKQVDENFNDALEQNIGIKEEEHITFKDNYAQDLKTEAKRRFTEVIDKVATTISSKLGIKVRIEIYEPTVYEAGRMNSGESVFNIKSENGEAVIKINGSFVDDLTGEIPNATLTHEATHTTVQLMTEEEIEFLGKIGNQLFEHSSELPSVAEIKKREGISDEQRKRGINNELIAYSLQTIYQRVANSKEGKKSGLNNLVNFLQYVIASRENLTERYENLGEGSVKELKSQFKTEEEIEKYLFKKVNSKYFDGAAADFIYEYAKILSGISERTADIEVAKLHYQVGFGGASLTSEQKSYYNALIQINDKFKLNKNVRSISNAGIFRTAEVLKKGKTIAEVNWNEIFAKKAAIQNVIQNTVEDSKEAVEKTENKKKEKREKKEEDLKVSYNQGIEPFNHTSDDLIADMFSEMISKDKNISKILGELGPKIVMPILDIAKKADSDFISIENDSLEGKIDYKKAFEVALNDKFSSLKKELFEAINKLPIENEESKTALEKFINDYLYDVKKELFADQIEKTNNVEKEKKIEKKEREVKKLEEEKKATRDKAKSLIEEAFTGLNNFFRNDVSEDSRTFYEKTASDIEEAINNYIYDEYEKEITRGKNKGKKVKVKNKNHIDFNELKARLIEIVDEYKKKSSEVMSAFNTILKEINEYEIENLSYEELQAIKEQLEAIRYKYNKAMKVLRGTGDSIITKEYYDFAKELAEEDMKKTSKAIDSETSVETNSKDKNTGTNIETFRDWWYKNVYEPIVDEDDYVFKKARAEKVGNKWVAADKQKQGSYTLLWERIDNELFNRRKKGEGGETNYLSTNAAESNISITGRIDETEKAIKKLQEEINETEDRIAGLEAGLKDDSKKKSFENMKVDLAAEKQNLANLKEKLKLLPELRRQSLDKALQEKSSKVITSENYEGKGDLMTDEISAKDYKELLEKNQNFNGNLALPISGANGNKSFIDYRQILGSDHKFILLRSKGKVVGAFSAYYSETDFNSGKSKLLNIDTFVYSSSNTAAFADALLNYAMSNSWVDKTFCIRMVVDKNIKRKGSLPNLLFLNHNQKAAFSIKYTSDLTFTKRAFVTAYFDPNRNARTVKARWEHWNKLSPENRVNGEKNGELIFNSYEEARKHYVESLEALQKDAKKEVVLSPEDAFLAAAMANEEAEIERIETEGPDPDDKKYRKITPFIFDENMPIPIQVNSPLIYTLGSVNDKAKQVNDRKKAIQDLYKFINSGTFNDGRHAREADLNYKLKNGDVVFTNKQAKQSVYDNELERLESEFNAKVDSQVEKNTKKEKNDFIKGAKAAKNAEEKANKKAEKAEKSKEKFDNAAKLVKNPETKKAILENDKKLTEVKKAVKELLSDEKEAEAALKKLDKMIEQKEVDYQTIERLFQEEADYYTQLKTEIDNLNVQKKGLVKEFLSFQKLEGKIVENDIKKIQKKIEDFKNYIESEKAKLQEAHDDVLNQAVVEATYLLEATKAQADEIIKNAKVEEKSIKDNANVEAKKAVDEAKKEAKQIKKDAKDDADKTKSTAETEAKQIKKDAKDDAKKVYSDELKKLNGNLEALRTKIFDKEQLAKDYDSAIKKQKKTKKKNRKSLSEINAEIRSKNAKLERRKNKLKKLNKSISELKQTMGSYNYLIKLAKGELGSYKTANQLERAINKKNKYIKENRNNTESATGFSILDENNKPFNPQKSVLVKDDVELAKMILGYWSKLIGVEYRPKNKNVAKNQLALFKTFTEQITQLYSRVSSYFDETLSFKEKYAYNEIERLSNLVKFLNENPEFIEQIKTINGYIHEVYMFKGVEMRNIIDTTELTEKLEKLKSYFPMYYSFDLKEGLTFKEALHGKEKDARKFIRNERTKDNKFILGKEGIGTRKALDAGQKVNSTPVDRQKTYENIADVWGKAKGNKEKVSALAKWLQNHPMWLKFQKQILNKDVYFEKGLMEFGFSREEAMSMSLLMRKNKGVAGQMIETGRILAGKKVSSLVDAYSLVYNYFLNETEEGKALKKTLKYKKNGQIKSDSFEKMIHSCDLYMYNLYQIDNNEAIKKQLTQNKNEFLSRSIFNELKSKFGTINDFLPKLDRVNKIINSDEQTNENKIKLAAKFDSEDYRKQLEKYFKKAVKANVISEQDARSYTNKLVYAVQSISNDIKVKTVFGEIIDMESFKKTEFDYIEKYMPKFKKTVLKEAGKGAKFIWQETIQEVYQSYVESYKNGTLSNSDVKINDEGELVIEGKEFNKAWQSIMDNMRQFSNKELLAKNAQIEKELPFAKDYQKIVRDYLDEMQEYRVAQGILTRDEVDYMKEFYPNYVPTYREHISFNGTSDVLKGVNVTKDVQKRKGSNELISPLLGSIVDQTYSAVKKGSINAIFNSIEQRVREGELRSQNDQITLDQEYKEAPKIHSIEELEEALGDQKLAEKENNLITYRTYKEGTGIVTKQAVLTNDAMQTFSELESEHALDNFFIFKFTSKLVNKFTNVVTTLNPFFLMRNASRDIGDALFTTKHTSVEFAKEYAKSYAGLLGKNKSTEMQKMFDLFVQLGGTAGISYDSDNYRTNFDELIHKQNISITTKSGTKFNVTEALQRANEFVEAMPRFTEFRLSYEEYSKSSIDEVRDNASRLAMLDAARITTDFSRGGTLTKTLNRTLVPFLNAQVQGFQKVVDFASDFTKTGLTSFTNPAQRRRFVELLARLLAMGLLPELLSWLLNLGNDDYEALPEYTKAQYLLIPLGNGNFIKIPRGRIIGTVNNFFYQVGQQIAGKKDFKSGVEDFIDVASTNLAPVDLGSGIRTIFSPISDVKNNTTWYGQKIDNTSDLNKYGSQRYDASTSEIGKFIGKIFNYSPKRIDYLLESYTGVVGDILLPLATKSNYTDVGGTLMNFVTSNLSVNAVKNNRYRGESYELLQNLLYEKNAGSEVGTVQYNYLKRALDECKDLEEVVNQAETQAEQYTAYLTLREAYKQAISNTELIAQKLQGVSGIDTSDRYTMTELYHQMFGAEYALKYYNSTLGAKATIAKAIGINAETLYTAYFAVRGVSTTTEAKLIVNRLATSYYGRLWLKKAVGLSLTSAEETKLSRYLKAKGLSS